MFVVFAVFFILLNARAALDARGAGGRMFATALRATAASAVHDAYVIAGLCRVPAGLPIEPMSLTNPRI